MRMNKSLVLSFLALILVLSACGGTPSKTATTATDTPKPASNAASATPAPATPVPAAPVSITAYAYPADKTEENATLDAKIKRFTAKNPNVTITPKYWKYENTEVAIKMASNSAQTEFTTWATEGKLLSGKKWILDLTDNLSKWKYTKDLNEFALKPFIIEGKTYGIPIDAYGMTITINKKLFADKGVALPPLDWTWDDLIKAAKAVNDPGKGIAGFIPMGKGTEAGWNWTNFLYSAGGEIETVAGGKVTAAFNSDAGLKALQFYKDLKDANVIPQNWALGYGDALTLFNQGRGAMVMCGSGNALDGAINQGGLSKDDVLLYPIPSMTKGGKHIGVAGGNYKVINGLATKEQQQAAFNFVVDEYFTDAYLDSIDTQIKAQKAKNQVYVPQLINYWNDNSDYGKKYNALLEKHDNVYKYSPELNKLLESKPEATYETQAYYLEMSNAIQKVFTSKGALDLKQILDDSAAKVQKGSFDKVKVE
ncbi:extracellular solute-binding protein [Paenibacillus sp. GP183]|uniref:ABC transporter substrate-binding protein n=1 Tax=Paenibacillus sp. GP183 TaxID=1882751 RepID=UPI00089C786F|nr:extracellular solute-binding protein [Paenibacillus sp. GP183]SEB71432.1 ABC-type glycerol-3-phosphate transport system, substrate-binding protein [Paenibacillus sp. GP183]